MRTTQNFLQTWVEARIRFSDLLKDIKQEDLKRKLINTKNTAGFIIRHIADVELLFAKNVFNCQDLKVLAKTLIAQHDTGEWTNLDELLLYQQEANDKLMSAIEKQTERDWTKTITTREFGSRTKAEALGRIISHTAYHAGQLALTLKYGSLNGELVHAVFAGEDFLSN